MNNKQGSTTILYNKSIKCNDEMIFSTVALRRMTEKCDGQERMLEGSDDVKNNGANSKIDK